MKKKKTILYIDGQNFLGKLKDVFKSYGTSYPVWSTYNFRGLLDGVLEDIKIDERNIYFATIHAHPATPAKSIELKKEMRRLKTWMGKQGFQYIKAGNVRAYQGKSFKGEKTLSFREKGVDVKMAIDMVVAACDKKVSTIILASSDSDYQPAVKEVTNRGVECIYLGFEQMPNKGLMYTTNRTILVRNSEVIKYVGQDNQKK